MKIEIRKSLELGVVLAAIVPLVMAGCGGGGGSTGGTPTDVKSALNQTLQNGTVVISQFKRKDLTAITGVSVNYTTEVSTAPGISDAVLSQTAPASTDFAGQTNIALAAGGVYKQSISGTSLFETLASSGVTAVNAVANPLIAVNVGGASQFTSYRGEEYKWNITTPAATSVDVTLVQVDASTGKPSYGSGKYYINPLGGSSFIGLNSNNPVVLNATGSSTTSFTSRQISTEVLPGSYRAVITSRDALGKLVAAPFVSDVFTSTAATASAASTVSQTATLLAGKSVILVLKDVNGNPISTGTTVAYLDATTFTPLGYVTPDPTTGEAAFTVSSTTTSVIALVSSGGVIQASYVFTNIAASASVTLQQRTVTGTMSPTACSMATLLPNNTVEAVESFTALQGANLPTGGNITVAANNGDYAITLFGESNTGIQYTLNAKNVLGCPTPTPKTVTVLGANLTSQNLGIAAGGAVSGNISNKISTTTATAVTGLSVAIWQSTTNGYKFINSAITDSSGNYKIELPYGTYMLWANGSVTENIVISATAPTVTQNLIQYNLVGAITKNNGGALQVADTPTVYVGTNLATANKNGVYSIKAMEGKTWFCVAPGGNDLAFATQCNMNILINASTVSAAGQ